MITNPVLSTTFDIKTKPNFAQQVELQKDNNNSISNSPKDNIPIKVDTLNFVQTNLEDSIFGCFYDSKHQFDTILNTVIN